VGESKIQAVSTTFNMRFDGRETEFTEKAGTRMLRWSD